MIDLSDLEALDWRVWEAARARAMATTPPTPILLGEALRGSFRPDVVDGVAYVADSAIPLCFSRDETPPPRPAFSIEPQRQATAARLQGEIRALVDRHLPPDEREALAALMQRTTLMRLFGAPVDEGASLGLVLALSWAEDAMILGAAVAARAAACATIAELDALTVDLSTLGEPPKVTAGELAALLRAG